MEERTAVWNAKLIGVLTLAVVGVLTLEQSQGEWALATDVQKYYRCLPFDWYVVTPVADGQEPEKGDLVQFKPPVFAPRFTARFEVIKIVAAQPGEHWRVENDRLFVNNELWGDLHLMTSLGEVPGSLDGEGVVPDGHVYVLGTNPSSYDSRYWGPLPEDHITGYAHVVF